MLLHDSRERLLTMQRVKACSVNRCGARAEVSRFHLITTYSTNRAPLVRSPPIKEKPNCECTYFLVLAAIRRRYVPTGIFCVVASVCAVQVATQRLSPEVNIRGVSVLTRTLDSMSPEIVAADRRTSKSSRTSFMTSTIESRVQRPAHAPRTPTYKPNTEHLRFDRRPTCS
ncbi:hypothetical protein BC629DRAFT_334588 [Irpex lacteus]|nr:hypothetical protein BC629DRAFT_334588 [Irpex lacteus]